jgi:hypothetical protein
MPGPGEFLRRNPNYRASWTRVLSARRRASQTAVEEAQRFGMVALADPSHPASGSLVLWRGDISSFVLPLHADYGRNAMEGTTVDLSGLRGRAAAELADGPIQHVLFLEEGRRLQLTVTGDDLFGRVRLLTDAPCDRLAFKRRMSLLHRLADLLACGNQTRHLYPPEPRGRRLAVVLRALDGWLAKTAHRALGEAMFNADGRAREWRDCECPLRERLRLTLRRGRWLMDSGYRTLLE